MRASLAELGIAPRLLTREQAASYCGLSAQGFAEWVKLGRLPGAIEGTCRWDLKAIDAALDAASGLATLNFSSALDAWEANRTYQPKSPADEFEAWEREHEQAKAARRR